MSTLHDTLTEYLSTQEGSPKLKKLAIEQLENRITQEIVEQEATKIENKALELQRERTEKERYEKINQRIKDAERTFLVVVVLGLMIGLAGNQITEIISSIKEQFEVNRAMVSFGITVFIAFGIYFVVQQQYISTATDLINDFFRKGHEEQ